METTNKVNGLTSSDNCLFAFLSGLNFSNGKKWERDCNSMYERVTLSPLHAQANVDRAFGTLRRRYCDPGIMAALVLCEKLSEEELQGFAGCDETGDSVRFQVVDRSTGRWTYVSYRLSLDLGIELK